MTQERWPSDLPNFFSERCPPDTTLSRRAAVPQTLSALRRASRFGALDPPPHIFLHSPSALPSPSLYPTISPLPAIARPHLPRHLPRTLHGPGLLPALPAAPRSLRARRPRAPALVFTGGAASQTPRISHRGGVDACGGGGSDGGRGGGGGGAR